MGAPHPSVVVFSFWGGTVQRYLFLSAPYRSAVMLTSFNYTTITLFLTADHIGLSSICRLHQFRVGPWGSSG